MDTEVKKLENEMKEAFLDEKPRMARQGMYSHTDKLESYHRELVSLLPWLRLHLAKRSDEGSALKILQCTMPITTMEDGDSLRTMIEDEMEPRNGGAAT